jgi:thiol-disulfide isomerase/thioredoxin
VGRRSYLIAAISLIAIAVGAVLFASGTTPSTLGDATAAGSGRQAPAFAAKGWINSDPLTAADLKGKVVVYDFWTYSCVNCVRTIPHVEALYQRYAKDGLVVIGVHSPEFEFEKDHDNVRAAVKKLHITYPVALDDEKAIWFAFANQYWPAKYIHGRDGKEAFVHFGEGAYDETEDVVRKLLGVADDAPRAKEAGKEDDGFDPSTTPETYNGSERGFTRFASPEGLEDGETTFTNPGGLNPDQHALTGRWLVTPEYVEAKEAGASLVIHYVASEVNLVLASGTGSPLDVTIRIDDDPPRTLRIEASDLYNLVRHDAVEDHTLTLTATTPGVQAFAFTFGG